MFLDIRISLIAEWLGRCVYLSMFLFNMVNGYQMHSRILLLITSPTNSISKYSFLFVRINLIYLIRFCLKWKSAKHNNTRVPINSTGSSIVIFSNCLWWFYHIFWFITNLSITNTTSNEKLLKVSKIWSEFVNFFYQFRYVPCDIIYNLFLIDSIDSSQKVLVFKEIEYDFVRWQWK